MSKKVLPWIKTVLDNNTRFSSDTFFKLSVLVKDMYYLLRPIVDSDSQRKFLSDDDKIDSDFKYKRFYHQDLVLSPERYFKYNFGVVIIELVHLKGSYSVRVFNYEFLDDVFCNGWYSSSIGKLVTISTTFRSGYFYYGSFERHNFSVACEFFQFLVRCFQDNCIETSFRNYLHFSDNP